jgi:hypothetical protein
MSGGEIIGDIAQGALIARAVEPTHGEGGDGHTHERACLNCATPLVGPHCHQCGQHGHVHRTLGAFFHDLLHGVFHFEGKIWRTLPLLAWQPGRLTREYIDGKRASYVSPIALFLFVVFLTFALFNLVSDPIDFDLKDKAQVSVDADKGSAELEVRRAKLETELAAARAAGKPTERIVAEIAGIKLGIDGIHAAKQGRMPDRIVTSANPTERGLADRVNATWGKARDNPELAAYKLQSSAYKYSWLLIPLSVPFVWLLFPFSRRFHLYDHTVFVTYSLCFMMIALAAGTAISVWTMLDALVAGIFLYTPFHLYRQLRGTYGLTRFGALWRTWVLLFFAAIALALFAMTILGLSMG